MDSKYAMRGPVREVFKYLKTFNPNTPIPDFAKSIFTDISAEVTGTFGYPVIATLKYFCNAEINLEKMMFISRPEPGSDAINTSTRYATASLCEMAIAISEDQDIKNREEQSGTAAPMIPMTGVEVNATIVIPGSTIMSLNTVIESLFGSYLNETKNAFGMRPLPDEYPGDEYVSKRIFEECMHSVTAGKFSMFLKNDEGTIDWMQKHYFSYASNPNHRRQFTLASLCNSCGELTFFGGDAKSLGEAMTTMKTRAQLGNANPDKMPYRVRAVVTSPIHDLFTFMLMGATHVKIIAVAPLSKWLSNPIDVNPAIVGKYGVRMSEPVAVIKRYIASIMEEKPGAMSAVIDDFFNGHMLDYILEFDPGYDMSGFDLSVATKAKLEEFLKTVNGVIQSIK